MKNVIIAVALVMVLVLASFISLTIFSNNSRQNEVDEALTAAVEQALENLKIEKHYAVETEKEFVADFTQRLILGINSDSDITVNILAVDIEKGLLDVEVVETYKQVNGSTGTASCRKTVILEEIYKDQTMQFTVAFMVEKEYATGEFVAYKTFSLSEGGKVIVPGENPKIDGYEFKYWSLTKPTAENSFLPEQDDDAEIVVDEDLVFYAVFE